MDKLFVVSVVSLDKILYEGKAVSLVAPAETGYIGILANHAPLASLLVPGKIIIKEASGDTKTILSKEKGFLEVLRNKATLLLG